MSRSIAERLEWLPPATEPWSLAELHRLGAGEESVQPRRGKCSNFNKASLIAGSYNLLWVILSGGEGEYGWLAKTSNVCATKAASRLER